MIRARNACFYLSNRFQLSLRTRNFCSNGTKKPTGEQTNAELAHYHETYRQLDKLDFPTAAKILFTEPPKKKKFGLDFHLVQLFFACMPSLAIYLVAMYSRSEMRKMEAVLEQKKKLEGEKKAKEIESSKAAEIPELSEVKVRLDKLEEAVKEIAVEPKKPSGRSITKNRGDGGDERHSVTMDQNKVRSDPDPSISAERGQLSQKKSAQSTPDSSQEKLSGSTAVSDTSTGDQRGNTQNGKPTQKS